MSITGNRTTMTERKQQILQAAINIIIEAGYGALTMRALARADGIKLGALQYHFKTRDSLLRALVGYIADSYRQVFKEIIENNDLSGIDEILALLEVAPEGDPLHADRLFPQLWAMGLVEPLVADLMNEIYATYLNIVEENLKKEGSVAPRAEALCIMSLMEGSILFVGKDRPWESDQCAVHGFVKGYYQGKYGKTD
jgi:AcrR family transcriptional regulator